MPIKITSKKDGFRRAGREHTGIVEHPDGTFTPEELEILKAEPMLLVEIVPEIKPEVGSADKPERKSGASK
jgi:hypothetical protein